MAKSSDIGKKSDWGISEFWISGQSLIKENCHNYIISDDIDMKLGPVTKSHKRNKKTSKIFDGDSMLEYCDIIVIFPIANSEQSVTWIWDTQSVKLMFSLNVTFNLTKTENRTKIPLTQLLPYYFK